MTKCNTIFFGFYATKYRYRYPLDIFCQPWWSPGQVSQIQSISYRCKQCSPRGRYKPNSTVTVTAFC